MDSRKGLGKVISALLAASSLVGQASAARVKGPAGKVKVDKKVVNRERKRHARSAELDVDGRRRRGKAINAYASPLDDPRNWAVSLLGISTLGSGGAAFHYYNKASKDPGLVLDFGKEVMVADNNNADADNMNAIFRSLCGSVKEAKEVGSLYDLAKDDKGLKFFKVDAQGKKVNEAATAFKDKCYYEIDGIAGEPIHRSLSVDIGVYVDFLLVKILKKLGSMDGILDGTGITLDVLKDTTGNLVENKCVTSLRKHLRNACDKFLNDDNHILGVNEAKKKNLAEAKARIAHIFDGAELFEALSRSKLSGFANEYEKIIRPPAQPNPNLN